jgi:hypothetical protein
VKRVKGGEEVEEGSGERKWRKEVKEVGLYRCTE